MPPRMRTRSVGRPVVESRGGGTGERVGRSGRGRGHRGGNDERVNELNGQGNDQGMGANRNVEGVNGGNVRNVLVNRNRVGCSYKKFLACNPKEYDGKGDATVLTRWIEKMKSVQDTSGCSIDQKVKYTAGSIEEFCPSHEMQKLETELWNHAMVGAGHATYTDRFHELARNGSIKKIEKRGNIGEPSKDKNGRDDNKRNRTGNSFAITTNPVRRENTGTVPKCTTCNTHHLPGAPCRTCFNCNRQVYFAKDCREVPRNVDMNLVNTRNPTTKAYYECDSIDHIKPACPKFNQAQGPGGNHPNQALTINGGMDWFSAHKAKIFCYEKVVKIPLLDGKEQKEIEVVRDFPEVFLDDLSGLSPVWEIEFRLELIPGVTPVVKSPYCLAPSKLEELSGKLKDLQDK
nr:hypothetical protein [Tanacetum cinerariifolium]